MTFIVNKLLRLFLCYKDQRIFYEKLFTNTKRNLLNFVHKYVTFHVARENFSRSNWVVEFRFKGVSKSFFQAYSYVLHTPVNCEFQKVRFFHFLIGIEKKKDFFRIWSTKFEKFKG